MSSCNLSTFEELDISEESEATSNFQRGGPLRNSGVRYRSLNEGLFYVNANNFAEMASQSRLIGDKTMFLKDLENDHTIRITMPRRMGKTMILTMLDAFFQIPKEGKPEKPEASSQFNLFCDTLIFKREESFVNQYFGKVPVIYMNLAGVTANTMADYLGLFKSAVQEMCEKFVDIIGVNENEPGLKGICKFMRTACDDWKNLDSNDLTFSIKMLSRLLHHHYGHEVLVLIDEYDTPINYLATAEDVSDDDSIKIQQFHQNFIVNSVKSNQHLWKVVVAGIMRISGKNQSSVTYFECNLLKCNKLSQYFGFNSVEIEKFLEEIKKQCGCEIAEKDMDLAKKWYNGYALDIGGETTSFYSPYSMCCFFNEYVSGSKNALKPYVSRSSILEHVTAYLKRKEIGDEILQLLVDDNFTISMRDDFEYTNDHLSLLRHACKENYKIIDMNKFKSAMHALLCHLGYLGYKDNKLRIANWEMRHHLNKLLRTYLEITYRFDSQMTAAVVDAIREIATLKTTTTKTLRHAFEAIIKKLPKRTILNESLTHALFTYLTANISEVDLRHEVNFRTKDGKQLRPDLCYQIGGKTTVVVEMKFGNHSDAALACTEAEYYARQLLSNIWTIGTEKFVMLGIHVTKKRVVTIEHSAIERSDIEDDNKENVHVPNKFVNTKNKTKKIQKA